MQKKLSGHPRKSLKDFYKELANFCENIESIDLYGKGEFLNEFEKELAELVGMEEALFLPSGVMAQLIAVKIYADEMNNNKFSCHETCHLIKHEEDAYKYLINCEAVIIGKKDEAPKAADLKPGVSSLIYELPMRHLGGDAPCFDELEKIKNYCQENKIKLHIDGARIFEVQPFYNKPVREIVSGADSMFLSFYKGFGSTSGSMLFGNKEFIEKARIWLRRFGGNLFQLYPLAIPARMNFNERKDSFNEWTTKAKEIGTLLKEDFNLEVKPYPVKTNMFHVHLPVEPKKLNQYFKDYDQVDLKFGIWEESPKGYSRCEFTVGEATMGLTIEEVRSYFNYIITGVK